MPLAERVALVQGFGAEMSARAEAVTWGIGRPRWQADETPRLALVGDLLAQTAAATLTDTPFESDDTIRRFARPVPGGLHLSHADAERAIATGQFDAVHSFTPVMAGDHRAVDIGVLWRKDSGFVRAVLAALHALRALACASVTMPPMTGAAWWPTAFRPMRWTGGCPVFIWR